MLPVISVPSSFRLTALVQISSSILSSNILFLFRLDTHHFVTRPHSIHCQSSLLHHFIPHPSAPITADVIPSNVLSHYPPSLPHHFVTQPHLILRQHHPIYHSISSLHLVPIERFRWNQMYSQTYLVPSKTFSQNQMPVPMGFFPCKTFSRNEIENTRSHQQANQSLYHNTPGSFNHFATP